MEQKEIHIVHLGGNVNRAFGKPITVDSGLKAPENRDFFIQGGPENGKTIWIMQGDTRLQTHFVLRTLTAGTWTVDARPISTPPAEQIAEA